MQIKVFPNDLIVRCVWDHYIYYVLGSDKEGEKILKENKEIELSERDALVIGLLKVIETSNLIHRFNTFIIDLLSNKSINNQNQTLIRKKTLDVSVDKFLDKFPDYWTPDLVYKKALTDLVFYIDKFKKGIENLEIIKITDQLGTYDFHSSNSVKKLISFQY